MPDLAPSSLITGPLADRSERILWQTMEGLRTEAAQAGLLSGLSRGHAGLALSFGYAALHTQDEAWKAEAESALARAVEAMELERPHPSLYVGYAGVAWAIDHLQRRLFGEDHDYNEAADEGLLLHMDEGPEPVEFDLIGGLSGIGIYALGRLHRGRGEAIAQKVIRCLEEESTSERDGITWWTAPELIPSWQRALHPSGHADLGMAHGIPGVIAFLSRAHSVGIDPRRTRTLIEGAVSWMFAHRQPDDSDLQFARTFTQDGVYAPTTSQVGWCYGDLGVALAIFSAGQALQRPEWTTSALQWARKAAQRPAESVSILEPTLCHGTIGAAQMFLRFHRATGESCFADASVRWLEETLSFWVDSPEHTGFRSSRATDGLEDSPWTKPWFLMGDAGLALGLLAHLSPQDPQWDRMLLMDITPP